MGAEAHVRQSEIWVVQSGEANLVIGGELVDPKSDPPENIKGTSIRNGIAKHISAGDILHIQAGTPHHLMPEQGKEITYFAIKITSQ
jgi:mannose-6-phosphate isomerase-like protein (cupin superfamily)